MLFGIFWGRSAPFAVFPFPRSQAPPRGVYCEVVPPFFYPPPPKEDRDPAITSHVCGRRKHKLGAERAAEGASVRQVVPFKSTRHGGGTQPATRSQPTPAPHCPPGGRRCAPPA